MCHTTASQSHGRHRCCVPSFFGAVLTRAQSQHHLSAHPAARGPRPLRPSPKVMAVGRPEEDELDQLLRCRAFSISSLLGKFFRDRQPIQLHAVVPGTEYNDTQRSLFLCCSIFCCRCTAFFCFFCFRLPEKEYDNACDYK